MQNRVTKRYWSYRSRGFALPSVLIAVTIFFAILATSCAALTSTNRSMREEWFTSAARHAAESGLAQAKACIAKSNGTPQWTSAKPLRPGLSDNSCAGSATACTTIPTCYVVASGSLRSSYAVSVPEITANGDSYTISAEGTAAIISGGVVSDTRKVIIKQTGGRTEVKFSPDFFSSDSISTDNNYAPIAGNALFLSDDGQVYQAASGSAEAPKLVGGALAGKVIVQLKAVNKAASSSVVYPVQYALTSEGKVYSWGINSPNCSLLGNGLTESAVPVAVGGALAGKVVTKIAATTETVWVLTSDGALYAWGCNSSGQFGNGTIAGSAVPVPVSTSGALAGKTIAKVEWTNSGVFAIDTNGKVYVWGSNMYGVLGLGQPYLVSTLVNYPQELDMSGVLAGKSIVQVAGTKGVNNSAIRVFALSSTGEIYGWGKTATNGVQMLPVAIEAPSGVSFKKICVGTQTVYAISATGVLYRATNLNAPLVQFDAQGVLSGKTIANITCLEYRTYAISTEGQVYTWGISTDKGMAIPPPVTWQLDGIVH